MKIFKFYVLSLLILIGCNLYGQEWSPNPATTNTTIQRDGNTYIGDPSYFSTSNSEGLFVAGQVSNTIPTALLFNYAGTGGSVLRLKGGFPQGQHYIFQVESNTWTGMPLTMDNIRFNVFANGYVGIGVAAPQHKLHIKGGTMHLENTRLEVSMNGTKNFKVNEFGEVRARFVKVDLLTIPDYVFEDSYYLMPLTDLERYIEEHKHLPKIKSANEYTKEGSLNLGELQLQLLEKIEELTLYTIQQQKVLEEIKEKNQILEEKVKDIQKLNNK